MSTAELSIRDELAAALKARAEPEPEVEAPEIEAEPAVESETQKQERARDEKGRFAAKSETSERPDTAATAAAGDEAKAGRTDRPSDSARQDSAVAAAVPEQPKHETALAPPNGWPAEAKAKWHELPAEIMAAVQQREKDIAKFTST